MRHLGRLVRRLLRSDLSRVSQVAAMSSTKIAVCQMTSVNDKEANYKIVDQLVSDAAGENAKMVFFPEACDYICDNKQDVVANAEPILTGNIVQKYRALAEKHNVWLSMGGVHEQDENNPNKMFNTHVIINNKGEIVQTYRKLHLFDVEIPDKLRLMESDFSYAGRHIVSPVETPAGKIGMAICYDMRFPELSTALSILDAHILTYPSAFTHATGVAHWHVLLRARAIENQCYVIAAAQTGQHNLKRRSYGHALVVDPWGEVLVDLGQASPGLGLADISADKLRNVRINMPVFHHRRKDVYSLHALSIRKSLLPEHIAAPSAAGSQTPDSQSSGPAKSSRTAESSGPTYVFGHVQVPESCVFYKTKLTYAFVNLRCVTPGHVLVAPIRDAERNEDLTDEEAEDFYRTIRLVQKLMEKVQGTSSSTVTIQDGPAAGQTVRHLHCHVMPRAPGDFIENDLVYLELAKHDHFKSGHPAKPARTLAEMQEEATRLKKEMAILLQHEKATV